MGDPTRPIQARAAATCTALIEGAATVVAAHGTGRPINTILDAAGDHRAGDTADAIMAVLAGIAAQPGRDAGLGAPDIVRAVTRLLTVVLLTAH